jgi:hypothetical protein
MAAGIFHQFKSALKVLLIVMLLAAAAAMAQYRGQLSGLGTERKAVSVGRTAIAGLPSYISWEKGRSMLRAGQAVLVDARILGGNPPLPGSAVWPLAGDEISVTAFCQPFGTKILILYGNDVEVGNAFELLKSFCRVKVLRVPQPYVPE